MAGAGFSRQGGYMAGGWASLSQFTGRATGSPSRSSPVISITPTFGRAPGSPYRRPRAIVLRRLLIRAECRSAGFGPFPGY